MSCKSSDDLINIIRKCTGHLLMGDTSSQSWVWLRYLKYAVHRLFLSPAAWCTISSNVDTRCCPVCSFSAFTSLHMHHSSWLLCDAPRFYYVFENYLFKTRVHALHSYENKQEDLMKHLYQQCVDFFNVNSFRSKICYFL